MSSNDIQGLLDGNEKKVQKKDKKVKTVNIVLAIVLAVFLWAYVIGEVNPETETSISGVPLNVVGENSLNARNLVVLTEFDDTITAVIKGRRSEIYGIDASRLSARIDVSDCKEGENQVSVKVTAPSNVNDAVARDGNMVVVVDHLTTEEKPVQILINGEQPEGTDMEIQAVNMETVEVSGPSTYVAKVVKVLGEVNSTNAAFESYSETVVLVPVDSDGNIVEGVELASSNANVDILKTMTKTVPVDVILKGKPADGIDVGILEAPKIKIKGKYSLIKSAVSLESEAVDISKITESGDISISVKLPDGVTAVDSLGAPLPEQTSEGVTIQIHLTVTQDTQSETEEQ